MLSILIPTWNNLPYLRLCVDGLRRHSAAPHEILVHVNDGADGTLQWVREQGLAYTHSRGNVGVCLALNRLAATARGEWLLYLNDDMFCTPGWDRALLQAAAACRPGPVFLSSRLIEPGRTGNELIHFADFGGDPDAFDERALLQYAATQRFADIDGAASQPTLVRQADWNLVGGYSIEFGPGMSSDDDFLMKLWLIGCRTYRVVGASVVYHFACRSTAKIRHNKGGRTFLLKWGLSQKTFRDRCISRTAGGRGAEVPNLPTGTLHDRVKRMGYGAAGYPMSDLALWEPRLPRLLGAPEDAPADEAADQAGRRHR
jgi:GT2 family glycosyltransferase